MNLPAPDLQINRAIRQVLVRHWIDLGRLTLATRNGSVLLAGAMNRLSGSREGELGDPEASAIVAEIRSLPGVRRLTLTLAGWNGETHGNRNGG